MFPLELLEAAVEMRRLEVGEASWRPPGSVG
jgi:hypothetical protein